MDQLPREYRDERQRRRLYAIFTVGMLTAAAICAVLGFLVLAPSTPLVRLGAESRFVSADDRPVDIAVKQLGISRLIPNRPTLSEDIIFVVRDRGAFRAFLGTDPTSGCFISWQEARQLFVDNCAQHSYGFTGRNTNQLATATSRPVNMVELPVTVEDETLYVQDRILRRDIR